MQINLVGIKPLIKKQFILGIMAAALFVALICLLALPKEQILNGVKLGTIDVGGKTKTGAGQLINKFQEDVGTIPVVLIHEDKQWAVIPGELGFYLNVEELVNAAYNIGRNGGWWQKGTARVKAKIWGTELPLEWAYDEQLALVKLAPIIEEVEKSPINAMIQVRGDHLSIVPGEAGWMLNEARLLAEISRSLNETGNVEIHLLVEEKQPAKTTEEVNNLGIDSLLGKFTTSFNINAVNRVHNIQLAANSIDGLTIPPGNVFSFNETVGPRTEASGYREAPVIVDNQLTTGLGGGICQVSSTLYNAALLANLTVLERRKHSLQVDYIAVGVDATVAYDYIDLKFINNTDHHLLINAKVEQDHLVIRIFGSEQFKKQVEIQRLIEEIIEPEEVIKVDQSLNPGESVVKNNGKRGYRTKVIRLIREKGEIIFEEIISEDFYPPEDKVVLLGADE